MYVWTFTPNDELSLATFIRPEDKTPEMLTLQELKNDSRYIAKLDKVAEETTVAPNLKQSRKRSELKNPEGVAQQGD